MSLEQISLKTLNYYMAEQQINRRMNPTDVIQQLMGNSVWENSESEGEEDDYGQDGELLDPLDRVQEEEWDESI